MGGSLFHVGPRRSERVSQSEAIRTNWIKRVAANLHWGLYRVQPHSRNRQNITPGANILRGETGLERQGYHATPVTIALDVKTHLPSSSIPFTLELNRSEAMRFRELTALIVLLIFGASATGLGTTTSAWLTPAVASTGSVCPMHSNCLCPESCKLQALSESQLPYFSSWPIGRGTKAILPIVLAEARLRTEGRSDSRLK